MRHKFESLAKTPEKDPMAPFGWGLGFQQDQPLPAIKSSAPPVETLLNLKATRYRVQLSWAEMVANDSSSFDHGHLQELSEGMEQMLDDGFEPMIALDNLAVPAKLAADGGWRNAATARAYVDFVGAVGARLGHLVDDWLTMASPWVDPDDVTAAANLVDAHLGALSVLRAHCPLGRIGATVDVRQFDACQSPSARSAAEHWLAALADNRSPIDFAALNVDQLGTRRATEIADVVRALATRTTARSFLLVQVVSVSDRRSVDTQPAMSESEQHDSIVAPAIEQMQTLRSEGIALCGAFTWPFEAGADGNPLAPTGELSTKHRQFASAAMS